MRKDVLVGLLALAISICGYSTVRVMARKDLDKVVERQVAWAQFTYDYSTHEWCVNAQRRDAIPGAYVGGCFKTLHEAEEEILK